jgi:uncharacterized protein
MTCPVCKVDLLITDKQGIEIDYCPKCRGIWLDRGELDKIIERSNEYDIKFESRKKDREYRDDDDYKYKSQGYHKHKRKSFLGELFDF